MPVLYTSFLRLERYIFHGFLLLGSQLALVLRKDHIKGTANVSVNVDTDHDTKNVHNPCIVILFPFPSLGFC